MNAPKTLPAAIAPANGVYGKAKSFLKFYKTGVVNVYKNFRASQAIRKEYNARSTAQLIGSFVEYKHLLDIQAKKHIKEPEALQGPTFSREQLLVLARTPPDAVKLPLFGVILAVFFEFTPLILLAFPRLSPSTCYSVAFRKKLADQYSKNRQELLESRTSNVDSASSLYALTPAQTRAVSRTVFRRSPVFTALSPSSMLQRKLLRHIQFVRADDYFLRENSVDELDPEEVELACRDRALDISGSLEDQKRQLSKWVESFVEPADVGMFFGPDKQKSS